MRPLAQCWLGLLLCAAAGSSFAQDFANSTITTRPLRGNLQLLVGEGSNVVVSTGPDGTLLVDDEYAELNAKLRAALAAMDTPPVEFIVNTHWHNDHTGGNESFGSDGATIIAHENATRRMQADQTMSLYGRQAAYPPVAWPSINVQDSLHLRLNGEDIDIVHADPSHTDSDLFVYFRQQNVLATGDLYVTGAYLPPYFDDLNGGNAEGMIAAAGKLLELADDRTLIVPGHGPVADRGQLQRYRDHLVAIRKQIRDSIAAGMSEDAVVALQPADGFVPAGKGTDRWIRILYREYSRPARN